MAGDVWDHLSDTIKYCAFALAVIVNDEIDVSSKWALGMTTVAVGCFTFIQYGCQERAYDERESSSTSSFRELCPSRDPGDTMRLTRWLGPGTLHVVVTIFLIYFAIRSMHGRRVCTLTKNSSLACKHTTGKT